MSKNKGARKRMPVYVTIPLTFAAIAAVIFFLWYRSRRDPYVYLVAAAAVPDGFVLQDRRDRLFRVRADGTVTHQVDARRGTVIRTWAPDALWLSDPARPLYVRNLPRLSAAGAVDEAIAAHSVLSRGLELQGQLPDGRALVQGRDRSRYIVSTDGSISPAEGSLEANPIPPRDTDEPDNRRPAVGVPSEQGLPGGGPGVLGQLDLIRPSLVMDWATGTPARFPQEPAFLVASRALTGANVDHVLSRAGTDGAVAWSVSAADMVGPTDLDSAVHHVLGVQIFRDRVLVVAQAVAVVHVHEMDPEIESEPRVVVIDGASGAIRSRARLSGL